MDSASNEFASNRQQKEVTSADLNSSRDNLLIRLREAEATLKQARQLHLQDMQRAEILRSRTAYGANEYRTVFQRVLSEYKTQRAWTVMLIIRKGFTLLFRRGLRGQFEFFKWLVSLPFSGPTGLDEYDLTFPDLTIYQPEDLTQPLVPSTEKQLALDCDKHRAFASLPPLGVPSQTKYDVIVLAIIDYDFRYQRPQQIAAQFAKAGHRVFWVSPSRFLAPTSESYQLVTLEKNLWEVRVRSRPLDIYMGSLNLNDQLALHRELAHLYRDLAVAEAVVILQLPFWREVGLKLRDTQGSKLIYDCMDDWDTFLNIGSFNRSEELDLAKQCDLLLVSSQGLLEKFERRGLEPVLVRNGADFEFFQSARSNDLLAETPAPIVGYFGAIADWIDLDLVYGVARLRPKYSFVLIGEVFNRDVSKLMSLKNVFLLGNKSYREIPSYLFHFDVCIIPFLLNKVTHATDPVKLYEYLSLGKPVVATDMHELRRCSDLIYIASTAEEFATAIDIAVHENDKSLQARRSVFALENTWAQRVSVIDHAIETLFDRVSILIVTHNSAEFVRPCLSSIRQNTSYPHYEIIIVDNASDDDTSNQIRSVSKSDSRIHFIALNSNRGFSAANNIAAEKANGAFFVLLNIDTLVTPGWLERLKRPIVEDAMIGLVSAVTNFAGNEVKINVAYRNQQEMENFAIDLAREKRGEILHLRMAPLFCSLIPRTVWETVRGLDESFGVGMFEDDDICQKLRRAGFHIVTAEDCFVHHFGQGSFQQLTRDEYDQIFESNRRRYEQKWNVRWRAHNTRSGVRPAHEDIKYGTADFKIMDILG